MSRELYIGHEIEGNLCMPKNNCFLSLPMYWPMRNLKRVIFCEYGIAGLDYKLLDNLLSIYRFIVHLAILGNFCALISRILSRPCFWMYVFRHL